MASVLMRNISPVCADVVESPACVQEIREAVHSHEVRPRRARTELDRSRTRNTAHRGILDSLAEKSNFLAANRVCTRLCVYAFAPVRVCCVCVRECLSAPWLFQVHSPPPPPPHLSIPPEPDDAPRGRHGLYEPRGRDRVGQARGTHTYMRHTYTHRPSQMIRRTHELHKKSIGSWWKTQVQSNLH